MAGKLDFKELYAHLEPYVPDPKRRFSFVSRIKRGLKDQSEIGGSGKSQVHSDIALSEPAGANCASACKSRRHWV
jgi:hypothetical protein